MKRLLGVAVLSAALVLSVLPTAAAGATPYCGITWGSAAKTGADTNYREVLKNIRTGQHDCYDRMVLDLSGNGTGYRVSYITPPYRDEAGIAIPVSGGAVLQITVEAPSYDPATGKPTYNATVGQRLPNVNLAGYQTFREAKFAGSFEGQTTVVLGVRAQLPMRVTKADNRVIVDVAHKW